ncbi:MAG: ShlB/FhaC/HecB family hemolysin secretion/activation protein [Verrucomicrobiota bacterium]
MGSPLLRAQIQTQELPADARPASPAATVPEPSFHIQEYRVQGSKTLPPLAVEEAVYPFLGRARTAADVEKARAALEKAYHAAGWQAVTVEVPPQDVAEGVVFLRVSENPVGRLRVRGTKYFTPSGIRARAPELAEGTVLNFNDVNKAVMRLNRLRDLRITPELKPGAALGTFDVDLKVRDSLPLHGSIELNNRYSANTVKLRLNGSVSYENLWQAGHSAGFNFQVAPEKPSDATVYSAYYLARFKEIDWLTLLIQGTKQNSDVSTLGGAAVAGRGSVVGFRLLAALPGTEKLFHSLSAGVDWKNFKEDVLIDGQRSSTPVEYFPLTVNYGATWTGKNRSTDLNAGLNFGLRGAGSDRAEFDAKRYDSTGAYLYLRGDLAHTQELPGGFQLYAKVQGQASPDNLINSEQFSGGGIGTVRGYLESSALGDNAVLGTIELRSPSLIPLGEKKQNEWRLLGFVDGGQLWLNDALPEQQDTFDLMSVGLGTRMKLRNHFNGSLDLGFPLKRLNDTERGDWQLSFRVWGEF